MCNAIGSPDDPKSFQIRPARNGWIIHGEHAYPNSHWVFVTFQEVVDFLAAQYGIEVRYEVEVGIAHGRTDGRINGQT